MTSLRLRLAKLLAPEVFAERDREAAAAKSSWRDAQIYKALYERKHVTVAQQDENGEWTLSGEERP